MPFKMHCVHTKLFIVSFKRYSAPSLPLGKMVAMMGVEPHDLRSMIRARGITNRALSMHYANQSQIIQLTPRAVGVYVRRPQTAAYCVIWRIRTAK